MDRYPVRATQPPTVRRAQLARAWTNAATASAYIPRSVDELELVLLDLVDQMLASLADDSPRSPTSVGSDIGERLVNEGFIDTDALRASIDVLAVGLLGLLDRTPDTELARRTVALLGALSAGYAHGLRDYTLSQQERLKQALFNAMVRAEHTLRAAENRFREVFASSAVGIAITDLDGMCVECNPALTRILACPPGQIAGRHLTEFFVDETATPLPVAGLAGARVVPGDLAESYQRVLRGEAERVHENRRLRNAEGETTWVSVAISLLHDGSDAPAYFVTMMQDVSELQLLSDRLGHQLLHDALTGLPNRQQFESKLETTLGQAAPTASITLFLVNLDGFALVNNSRGHAFGDRVLRMVGRRLEAVVAGERAMVARLGGDEFAVLIEDLPTTPDIATIIDRINAELGEPEYVDDRSVAVVASAGAVRCRAGEMSPTALFQAADTALRKAKASGRRQWASYHVEEDGRARERDALAAELPAAWENGELTVCYEPVVRLDTDKAVAARAVLSWAHGDRVLDHPLCVELAERTGLSVQLGPTLLLDACAHLATLREVFPGQAGPLLRAQLPRLVTGDGDLARAVHQAVVHLGPLADRLEIALDTGALLDDVGDARDNLQVLAEIGVTTGLCGFQGGPRELDLMADPAVRTVTLAVAGVGAAGRPDASEVLRSETSRLVRTIVDSGRECSVLAVRTEQEARWWASVGASSAQGGVFGGPVGASRLPDLPERSGTTG